MTKLTSIEVRLTRDRFNKPLAIIETHLGSGQPADPAMLRGMASALLLAAAALEARPTAVKHFMDVTRHFPIQPPPSGESPC